MKTITVSLLLSGFLIPAASLAESPGEPMRPGERPEQRPGERAGRKGGPEARKGGPEARMAGWKLADTDGDGFISREEFAAMPRLTNLEEEKRLALFTRLDKDGDGKLSQEEIRRMMRPQDGNQGPPMPRLAELDTDNSGGVSLEELRAGEFFKKLPPERQEAFFKRLDTDGDGEITPKDAPPRGPEGRRPPPRPQGERRGPEGERRGPDGEPRGGERPPGGQAPPNLRGMIQQLDQDADGKLSFEEFRKAPWIERLGEDEQEDRFEALDKNNDLVLDEADL